MVMKILPGEHVCWGCPRARSGEIADESLFGEQAELGMFIHKQAARGESLITHP